MSDDSTTAETAAGSGDPAPGTDATATAAFAERLAAVERAVTGDGAAPADLDDAAAVEERLARVETAVEGIDDRVSELEAATQALRGYVGGVRAVNRDVERRADLALARTEELVDGDAPAPPDAAGALDGRTPESDADAGTTGSGEPSAATADADTDGDGAAGIAARLRDAL